jgi:predicted acyltransferase
MLWILGADALVPAICALSDSRPARILAGQFEHKSWAGFGFYDLIFPLFVFIVGVSLVFSLTSLRERADRATAVKRVLRRAALLIVLGIFYNGGFSHPWPDVRVAGVLQRIALAYAAAGLLFCFCKPRMLAASTVLLLVGYWGVMTFVPIRDFSLERQAVLARWPAPASHPHALPDRALVESAFHATEARVTGRFEPGLNVADHVDFKILPGRGYDGFYDPEGVLSTIPAIATCLLGVFAGLMLQRQDRNDATKLKALVIGGLLCLLAGWLWNLQFPVIKKIWTSSFVLVAGGWSFLLLALFYYVIDVRERRSWCRPFVWVGMNPITLYLVTAVLSFHAMATRLVGGSVEGWINAHLVRGGGDILIEVTQLLLILLLARFLYQRKIFLRV